MSNVQQAINAAKYSQTLQRMHAVYLVNSESIQLATFLGVYLKKSAVVLLVPVQGAATVLLANNLFFPWYITPHAKVDAVSMVIPEDLTLKFSNRSLLFTASRIHQNNILHQFLIYYENSQSARILLFWYLFYIFSLWLILISCFKL